MSGNKATTHSLYRFFDAADDLLYVGRTTAPARRWREHEKGKDWFDEVAKVTREVFPSAEEVDMAERNAIATERPAYNIALRTGDPLRPRKAKPLSKSAVLADASDALLRRWISVFGLEANQVQPEMTCEGDETVCECSACHDLRVEEIDRLRETFSWHPLIDSQIDDVEQAYVSGHDLIDWYYELGDLDLFSRMWLVAESKNYPLPALAVLDEQVAYVDCPFCACDHPHFLTAGQALNLPITSGCKTIPGGQYALVVDFSDFLNSRNTWVDRSIVRQKAAS